jgi:non-heme chloroperoxidase
MPTSHRHSSPIRTRHLRTGVSVQYRETGDVDGAPLILLHGFTDSLRSWRPFTDALPPSLRVFAVTQRGHGDAAKTARSHRRADFVADLEALMDDLGLPRAHVCGHCMGGWVARLFALQHPERVLSLTVIAGFDSMAGHPALGDLLAGLGEPGTPLDPGFVRDFQSGTVHEPVPAAFMDTVVAESLKVPPQVWRSAIEGFEEPAASQHIVTTPTLLLAGEKDALFDAAHRQAFARLFRAPVSVVYPGLGHSPHWERPGVLADAVASFIESQALFSGRPAMSA